MSILTVPAAELPSLRRYARALTGAQMDGDALVAATLEMIAADGTLLQSGAAPRLALFSLFQRIWMGSPGATAMGSAVLPPSGAKAAAVASARLAALMPLPRQALLLAAMEGFAEAEIAVLLGCDATEVSALLEQALAAIAHQTRARVLIIEDEPIIAMDIEAIVTELGHAVTGIAATYAEALALFAADAPGLVLADIGLRDGSSGIDAVRSIVARQAVPAIFITGFPERLLTGQPSEPAFVINKPFQPAAVQVAVGQALFFNATAALHA